MTIQINLLNVPAPTVVETLSFETIFAEMLADLKARDPEFTALVESDPIYKLLEICSFRELLIRQRVNDASKSLMLAYATGSDLEQIGANFGVVRKTLIEGNAEVNPAIVAVYESDDDLRLRIQSAFNGISTAGPKSAYEYHALSVDTIMDVEVDGPPIVPAGHVRVTILSATGDGTATQSQIDAVNAKLNSDDIRPLTDYVTVQSATIVPYKLNITLSISYNWDSDIIIQTATNGINEYCKSARKVGKDVNISGIHAGGFVAGVDKVIFNSTGGALTTDLSIDIYQASYLTELIINTVVQ